MIATTRVPHLLQFYHAIRRFWTDELLARYSHGDVTVLLQIRVNEMGWIVNNLH